MRRVLAIAAYQQKFNAAFPGVPASQLGFQHAANAIAAFEAQTFTKSNSAFDRYLARDDNALSTDAKHGALLFFGKARCSSCHNGALLGAQGFANAGVPQLGPGTGKRGAARRRARGSVQRREARDAAVSLSHSAASQRRAVARRTCTTASYATLEAVVRHYNNADSALKAFDPSELDPSLRASYHGDAATIAKVRASIDGRLQQPMRSDRRGAEAARRVPQVAHRSVGSRL